MKMSQPKKQDKSLSPLQLLHRDVGTSPMEPVAVETAVEPVVSEPVVVEPVAVEPVVVETAAEPAVAELKPESKSHDKLKPVHIDVVHAIPIIPSIKPIHAIPITNKIRTRKTEKKTRTKRTLTKKQFKNKTQTKKLLKNKTQTNKKMNITMSSSAVL
jgi:hypothetical protein